VDRVRGAFRQVLARAVTQLPWLKPVEIRHCRECDRNQLREWRLFAHSGHERLRVCFAAAADRELTAAELCGMSAHELGHVVAEELGFPEHKKATPADGRTPFKVQAEADWIARQVLCLPVRYNDRTIQELVDPKFVQRVSRKVGEP